VLMKIVVHSSPEAVAEAVADRITRSLEEAGDRFTLGLAGGSTPVAAYQNLAPRPLDWQHAELWLSDERWVPHHDQRSNGRMAMETLVGGVGARFHRPRWDEMIEAADSAAEYDEVIRSIHDGHRPDLIHLGMGADGHTASLFPDTPALEERVHWIVANPVPSIGEHRITSTYPLLWSARALLVQAEGSAKAEAVRDSMAGNTPAGKLVEGDAEVEWHLDEEAAALIS
jgi:6-phosphogluconolactonase